MPAWARRTAARVAVQVRLRSGLGIGSARGVFIASSCYCRIEQQTLRVPSGGSTALHLGLQLFGVSVRAVVS